MTKQIAIFGAGGQARELAWLVESCSTAESPIEMTGFIDDNPALHGSRVNGYPVLGLDEIYERFPGCEVIIGVGSTPARERIAARLDALGIRSPALVHPTAAHSRWVELGAGSLVCAGTVITTNVCLGRHVLVNYGCTIGHDTTIDDFTTITHGVNISGHVQIGRRVYAGVGAVISNGTPESPLVIGDDVTIGAGAVVIRSVPAGLTVVGVPARPIQRKDE